MTHIPKTQAALDFDAVAEKLRVDERKKSASKSYRPHKGGPMYCEHCHGPLKEHRHGLSRQLGELILQLYRHPKREVMVRDLHPNYGKSSNFHVLRYFELVGHDKKAKTWWLTEKGEQFARITIRVQRYVWSWRAEVVKRADGEDDREGPMVLITELVPDYSERADYAERARPHAA